MSRRMRIKEQAPLTRHGPVIEVAARALRQMEASIEAAWAHDRGEHGDESDGRSAHRIAADPSLHPWRLVDAALDHLLCPDCGEALARGSRGCASCDRADGFRFAAQEPDRPGVPAGNEHALRVSTAVLRAPRRYPAWVVDGNRIHLPLFLAGQMPTRAQQEAMLAVSRRGVAVDTADVRSFEDLAARALDALANRSLRTSRRAAPVPTAAGPARRARATIDLP